jgi:hypothetical protein
MSVALPAATGSHQIGGSKVNWCVGGEDGCGRTLVSMSRPLPFLYVALMIGAHQPYVIGRPRSGHEIGSCSTVGSRMRRSN